jgi:hypothetical protein
MGQEVPYWRYEEAFKAVHSALSGLMAPPSGKRVTRLAFTWNADGTVSTIKAFMGNELLFTLTFSWNVDGTLREVART